MADEARSLKAYGELPENSTPHLRPGLPICTLFPRLAQSHASRFGAPSSNLLLCASAVRVNETDTFADEEGANDEYFDFEDISGMEVCSASQSMPCMPLCGCLELMLSFHC